LGVLHCLLLFRRLDLVDDDGHLREPHVDPGRQFVDLCRRPPVALGVPEVVERLVNRGDRLTRRDLLSLQPGL
jgi:hypothetical protein